MSTKSPVQAARVTLLKTGKEPKSPTHVLYWMSTSLRLSENASLEHATHLSNIHKVPLRVLHLLQRSMADGNLMTERHALFQLQSVQDVSTGLMKRQIPFNVHNIADDDAVTFILEHARGAAAVIADADYLRPGRALRSALADALSIPFHIVEGNVVVPIAKATDKMEHAARTIRPKIMGQLSDYLCRIPHIEPQYQPEDTAPVSVDANNDSEDKKNQCNDPISIVCDDDVESALKAWPKLDRGAPRVTALQGGERQAQKLLDEFVESKIAQYAKGRNEPSLQLTSDLSPYLRVGCISPIDAALRVKEACKGKSSLKESCDSFIEELIVRRELSINACWFNDAYDDYEQIVPGFAQESLKEHESDKRQYIYSYEELEAAVTHDEYWNAAQLELVTRGKMHGYMRMYWAKQVLGWTKHPQEAMQHTLRLNNRWGLDAVDPNSYVGVVWCFGLHDRGWTERPVWGKVRYMNESGLKRKFDMSAYVAMVDRLISTEGLPEHITVLRDGRKKKGLKQSTLSSSKSSSRPKKRSKQN